MYLDYEEQIKMLQNEPKIQVGTIIECQGITSIVNEIYYSDRFVEEKNGEFNVFYDIEFRDTNGILRSWKSYFDGGRIVK